MPFALLYTSRNCVPAEAQAQAVGDILETSLAYNRQHAVTGALVSTPAHFAQILEGPRGAVTALMTRIEADPRHRHITILARETLPQRSFAHWSLAHIGNNAELDAAIAKFAERTAQGPAPGAVWALWNLMSELAARQFQADPSRSTAS